MRVQIEKNSWLNLTRLLSFNGTLFWDSVDFPMIPYNDDDTYIQISDADVKRMDNVAYEQYKDSNLLWVLLLANDKDLPTQFSVGDLIRVPSLATINTLLKGAQ